jgi:phytoene synthase
MNPADLEYCHEAIRTGSRSFWAASKLLPSEIRDPALALYAFCRLADDAVDEVEDKAPAVLRLRDRLERAYSGRPLNAPADRAFTSMIEEFDMPRALPEALLEGLAWDGMERRYDTLSDVRSYSARVASAVGAMMCVLMRVRDPDALARACDLGVAMQLTNIARDVGEDARARRIYLPLEWLDAAEINIDAFFTDPSPTPEVRRMVQKLLAEAHRLYIRSEPGIAKLPFKARPGIFAARNIYDGIGKEIRRAKFDSISQRAHTSGRQKIGWIGRAMLQTGFATILPYSSVLYAKPLPEVAFLVEAAAHPRKELGWGESVLNVLAQLEAKDRGLLEPGDMYPN